MGVMTGIVIILFGLIVGLLSGLVGLGGGVLMVPFLYFLYDHPDLFGVVVSPEARVVLAHGTSLFVIVPTSIRGIIAYRRANLVEWRAVWPIGVTSIFAALAATRLAVALPPEALKTAFGAMLIFSGLQLIRRRSRPDPQVLPPEPKLSLRYTILVGLVMGFFSALLGVGGGIVGIPLLIYLIGLDIKKVAATSMGIIILTASAATAGYVAAGVGAPGLPPWTLGYVHLSAGIALFLGAVVSVRWGAALNQRMQPRNLQLLFGVVFLLLGAQLAIGNLMSLLDQAGGGAPGAG
jgi:uncharacterized protein